MNGYIMNRYLIDRYLIKTDLSRAVDGKRFLESNASLILGTFT